MRPSDLKKSSQIVTLSPPSSASTPYTRDLYSHPETHHPSSQYPIPRFPADLTLSTSWERPRSRSHPI